MPNGTRVLLSERAALREKQRIADREEGLQAARRKQEQAVEELILRRRKLKALKRVYASVYGAIARLEANDSAGWKEVGVLQKVCKRSGPHKKTHCFLHSQEIALVSIPDSYPPVFLGADGRVYRKGWYKTYRAELMKRDWPSEILALIEKIDRIYT